MEQELTLSRNIVKYLYVNPPKRFEGISNANKCEEFIKQNKIIVDDNKDLITIFSEEIEKLKIKNGDEFNIFRNAFFNFISKYSKKYLYKKYKMKGNLN